MISMYPDVMIDLETIGNDYDGVFTTIGAVQFDIETGDIGPKFYQSVNWESAVAAGRTVTPATIKWWMEQSPAARAEILRDGVDIKAALEQFVQFLPDMPKVWGNGPTFDISKLEHALGYYSIPWKFWNVFCVRTMRRLTKGIVDKNDIPFEGEKHNALADAIHQAKYVSAMYRALRGGQNGQYRQK